MMADIPVISDEAVAAICRDLNTTEAWARVALTAAMPHLVAESVELKSALDSAVSMMCQAQQNVAERDTEIGAWKRASDEQIRHYNSLLNERDARIRALEQVMTAFSLDESWYINGICDPNGPRFEGQTIASAVLDKTLAKV